MIGQLAELARAGFTRSGFARFVDEQGWQERDDHFETASGHRLVPAVPLEDWKDRQPSFHLPFCYFDPSEEAADGPLGDEFHELSELDGWDVLASDAVPFFEGWRHGCEVVSGVLGQPDLTLTMEEEPEAWHFSVWRVGAVAVVVAQGEEFLSYGELSMAAVWLVQQAPDAPLPSDGAAFYSWLLGED
ncbi:hypothetical protein ACGFX4_28405 [Kitasatospora sp. NPDC048365]|uniref:hypothetical protein n=1 Tax=Kitasatospora sp. NPDC048365 TaxID=3364050 RepID=UPI00371A073B